MGIVQRAVDLARSGAPSGEKIYEVAMLDKAENSGDAVASDNALDAGGMIATRDVATAGGKAVSDAVAIGDGVVNGFSAQSLEIATIVRLKVPMPYVPGIPYVVALGLCNHLRKQDQAFGIRWPYDLCYQDQIVGTIKVTAGYDDGMFVVVDVAFDSEGINLACKVIDSKNIEFLVNQLSNVVIESLSKWEQLVLRAKTFAGPIALVLSDYFDVVPLLGRQVNKVYPNGTVAQTARFGGVDVWGHAILVDQNGKEISVSEDEASLVPAS